MLLQILWFSIVERLITQQILKHKIFRNVNPEPGYLRYYMS